MWGPTTTGQCGKSEEQLNWEYDLKMCIYWILFNNYKRICLQFSDSLLIDSYDVSKILEKGTNEKLFILGDTTYGSCCVDYVNAQHVEADSIIHFGRACLTSQENIPTLYVLPKAHLDISVFCQTVLRFATQVKTEIVILFDIAYSYAVDEIISELAILRNKLRVSRLATPQQNKEVLKWSSSDKLVTKFGRVFSIPASSNEDKITYIYILDNRNKKNMINFIFVYPNSLFYRYENETPGHLERCSSPEVAKRRLYLVHKIKEARRIGILICTLSTIRHLEVVDRIKELCKIRNKKSYIISVGKLNVPKLANFPEIDIFVMIGCPELDVPEEDFYQPIVTITEVELALNINENWWLNTVSDFREYLPGGSVYKEIDRNLNSEPELDVSLLSTSNKMLSNNLVSKDSADISESAIANRDPMTVSLGSANEGLAGRSWQGLELNIGHRSVEKAEPGLSGTPSGGYHYPSSVKNLHQEQMEARAENVLHSRIFNDTLRKWQCSNTELSPHNFMYPLFIGESDDLEEEIVSLPEIYRLGVGRVVKHLDPLVKLGLKSVLLFGVISKAKKDETASNADSSSNPVIRIIPLLKQRYPSLTVACDVCLCPYTSHGHCAILSEESLILNSATNIRLADIACSYAKAGADIVAPSDMMDGRVAAIKTRLIEHNLVSRVNVLSYSVKFSSCFYGPFRDAADSAPSFGDRRCYQLPPGSKGMALAAAKRDVREGCDMLMVKPALPYLDLIRQMKETFPEYPLFVYQVSGEYAMLYHAAKNGVFDLKAAVNEVLTSMRRAGADCIISYFTPKILLWIHESSL